MAIPQIAPAAKPTAEQIVKAWAETLTPANAPDMKLKGPLAWVRDEKVKELVAALAAGGYK